MTVQKPENGVELREAKARAPVKLGDILPNAARSLDPEHSRNPSYVYASAVREAIRLGHTLDNLHYSDVLVGLRELGFALDPKKGLLAKPLTPEVLAQIQR